MSFRKFGRNSAIGTSWVPVTNGGIYQMPLIANAKTLRVKAGGDANDDAAGTGARSLVLEGLGTDGKKIIEEIPTAGISASAASSNTFLRLYRAYIGDAGSHGSFASGTNNAEITIEASDGSADWAIINYENSFGLGQSQIAAYTTDLKESLHLDHLEICVESTKKIDLGIFTRQDILRTAAPFTPILCKDEFIGLGGGVYPMDHEDLRSIIVESTDIVVLARVNSGTSDVSVSMDFSVDRIIG